MFCSYFGDHMREMEAHKFFRVVHGRSKYMYSIHEYPHRVFLNICMCHICISICVLHEFACNGRYMPAKTRTFLYKCI